MHIFTSIKTELWKNKLSVVVSKSSMKYKRLSMFRVSCVTMMMMFCYVVSGQEYRSFDATGNNITNSDWGSYKSIFDRISTVAYDDGVSEAAGADRPNIRTISNHIFSQEASLKSSLNLSDFNWVFAQFLEHDMYKLDNDLFQPIEIEIPEGDEFFGLGSFTMFRATGKAGTGLNSNNPLEFENGATAYIDGSAIYGIEEERINWLRSHVDGKMRTSQGNLLPWNTIDGEFNSHKDLSAPFMLNDKEFDSKMFVTGDPRTNKHPLLIALHTIFVREHNRICNVLKSRNSNWSDDKLFLEARKRVVALIQHITYYEWLPSLGVKMQEYRAYNENANPGLSYAYAGAAGKFVHTMMNNTMVRMDNNGNQIAEDDQMKDAFFNPSSILLAGGIDSYLKGMASNIQQEMDCKVVNDVRNYELGSFSNAGMDLAAADIYRGRDLGLPDYNTMREDFGLPRVKSFLDITRSVEEAQQIEDLYGSIDNIDPWVGMAAEFHLPNSTFGQLMYTVIHDQFLVLRDADRFYYENDPTLSSELETIKATKLSDILLRNSDINVLQENVFEAMDHESIPNGPELAEKQLESAIYPNPASDKFTIKLFLEEADAVSTSIFDQHGRLIFQNNSELQLGINYIHFDLDGSIPKGMYNVVVQAGYSHKVLRLIKE